MGVLEGSYSDQGINNSSVSFSIHQELICKASHLVQRDLDANHGNEPHHLVNKAAPSFVFRKTGLRRCKPKARILPVREHLPGIADGRPLHGVVAF